MPDEEKETFEGTHGTSVTRANEINRNGFRLDVESRRKRAGKGIYFWLDGPYAFDLAVGWFRQAESEGAFDGEPGSSCAVIWAKLSAIQREILDLMNRTLRNRIAALKKEKKFKGSAEALHELFINELEREMDTTFKIVLTEVAPPKPDFCYYPLVDVGAPMCCVARDVGCISLRKMVTC